MSLLIEGATIMRRRFGCVVLMAAVVMPGGQAWGVFPAGNPLDATIPTSSWAIAIEDVLTIPNSSGQAPRLEYLTTGGAPGLAYVLDQRGRIYSFEPAATMPTPALFLDLSAAVANFNVGAQTGVRGLAFHPDFNNSGTDGYRKFFTSHSRNAFAPGAGNPAPVFFPSPPGLNHDSVVGEWTMNANGTVNTSSYREVMRIGQPFHDHNIGQIGFNPNAAAADPDFGNLYIALGDGGNNFPPNPIDPHDLAQDINSPHGSILRINPLTSGGQPYAIPADNPFRVSDSPSTSRNVIWAYGLRNPHRFTFDTAGDHKMLISDIGQSNIEEINLGAAGANYGWDLREGTFQTTSSFSNHNNLVDSLPANHASDAFTYPVAQYDHDLDNNNQIEGLWSVVGASVYRGSAVPELTGLYLFGEFAQNSGAIFAVDVDDLVQRDDFSNLPSLYDGHLAPFVQLRIIHNGQEKTLLQIIRDASGNQSLTRTDLRFGEGPDGEIYILNKHDGRVRRIAAVSGLVPGDYNDDGVVDAADFVVWRKNLGTDNILPNTPTPGPIDETEYERWRANFQSSVPGGEGGDAGRIPEPASALLLLTSLLAAAAGRRRGSVPR
jgi:Glucose / Sorbosone dehydrogenase